MGYRTSPSAFMLKWANVLALVVSLCILGIGIWLATRHGHCEKYLMLPLLVIGGGIFVISLLGYIAASTNISFLLWIYLVIYSCLLVGLALFTAMAFIITHNGAGYTIKSDNLDFKQYQIESYSRWLQHGLNKESNWKHISDCLLDSEFCDRVLRKFTTRSELAKKETSVEAGCCRPPVECGYPMINVTYYDLSIPTAVPVDCQLYQNEPNIKCFSCSSCRGGVAQSVKKEMMILAIANIVLIIFLFVLYIVGCCATHRASEARYIKMQKKGLEDIKQVQHSRCPGCSCGSCWQACLDCCCFRCSRNVVQEVEDISSPKNCYGNRKVPIPPRNEELFSLGQENTTWCLSCSPCCQNRRKRKRELAACNEPERIDLDDFDPTIVFEKKKALEDHDQVAYRHADDITLLDYLEAGWQVPEDPPRQGSKCFLFFCCKKKRLDTKQKGKAKSSCCTSPCGNKNKGEDLDNFKKNDNSLALTSAKQKGKSCCESPCGDRKKDIAVKDVEKADNTLTIGGASSGTLVWDKPPPMAQQDLSKKAKDQPKAIPVKQNTQIHDNVLFNQESAVATLPLKSPEVAGAPKTGQLPQGWSWLMDSSNSTNTPTNVDKKPDVQTRFVHILPEIVDTRFQLKSYDDLDISEKKEKKFSSKLKYKEREHNVETSLVQFAKPEIVDKRFQLNSKDDAFQRKEENFHIIEEDVERLEVLHNKLGILQQQLLQKEQILVLEDKLKEQEHLQRRREELALEKEQLEILREKTQGRGHLERNSERNSEDRALEKEHLALLQEVMNEKEQLERKKEEFILEKKHLEKLREEQLERRKEELLMEKKSLEMLREKLSQQEKEGLNLEKQQMEVLQRQLSLEEKGKLKMREQEIAIEKEKMETLQDKLSCKEKAHLEIKKEELSLQLEKTKEELAKEKQHLQVMRESLHSEEKVQIEKSKVQLASERKQLQELREKLNLKEKEELKKKKELLDNVLMELETLSKSLSSKETVLLDRKREVLAMSRRKDPYESLLRSNISEQEKAKFEKDINVEVHSRDLVKDKKAYNYLYKGHMKSKDERLNPTIPPPMRLAEKPLLGNSDNHKAREDWESQSRSYKKTEGTNCVGSFMGSSSNNCAGFIGSGSNNCSQVLKTTWPSHFGNQETPEELFEIENKRHGGIMELTRPETKGKHGRVEKRHKGKQHIEHRLGTHGEFMNCFKKLKEGAHNKFDKKDDHIRKLPKGGDDDKKRLRAIHEDNEHYGESQPMDFQTLKEKDSHHNIDSRPKSSATLKENESNHQKKLHKTTHSDDVTSPQKDQFYCGLTQPRVEYSSCSKAKQLLSYNFDPPKKKSSMEPQKKKAKKCENMCFVPPDIPPSCGGTKLHFPGRLMLSSCNMKDKAAECFNQYGKHERVVAHPSKDPKSNVDTKTSEVRIIEGKLESKSEKPRIKARFRFKGLLDEKAQNKLLGKLKELELQDLQTKLADKKKLLEKMEKTETSTSTDHKPL